MDFARITDGADRLAAYIGELASVIGHADRVAPLRDYCAGLLATEGRKSVEPIAAVTAPSRTSAQHQSLLHFVNEANWSESQLWAKVRELVVPTIERHGPVKAWIVDDTSYPKQGTHSVGVHHQYCGQLGKQANCQVAVTLSIANHHASLPIAYQLYLPKDWAEDAARRKKEHVPKAIRFKTKPQISLAQIRAALAAGVAPGVNPAYRALDGQVRKNLGILNRKIAAFGAINLEGDIEPDRVEAFVRRKSDLQENIAQMQKIVADLKAQRKAAKRHIAYHELPPQARFDRLSTQSKHLVDTIKMIAYRAETAMAQLVRQKMTRHEMHEACC